MIFRIGVYFLLSIIGFIYSIGVYANWNLYPDSCVGRGFWIKKVVKANLDSDDEEETAILLGRDVGHYPYFDLFKYYYVIADQTKQEVLFTSKKFLSDRMNLLGYCSNDPNMLYAIEYAGYQTLLLRGSEEAARGKVMQEIPVDFPDKDKIHLRRLDMPDCNICSDGSKKEQSVRVALITQSHSYDKNQFHHLMDTLDGVSWKVYETPFAYNLFEEKNRNKYDVLLFYDMCQEISKEEKKLLTETIREGKSVMILSHGFASFNQWKEFERIAGSKYLLSSQVIGEKQHESFYRERVDISLNVKDRFHFITQGISNFVINNEVYGRMWQSDEIHPLVSTAHPECAKNILYTHQYGKGRVVGLILAHGKGTFENENYIRMFNRSLLWLGKRDIPQDVEPVVLAYVTSWTSIMPDPKWVTHINYAFGHVAGSFDRVRVDNPERLKNIVKLKERYPDLKVLLSIGGWGSGNFSEMAAVPARRKAFAIDCRRVIDEFNLDGIDIDWEYPTSKAAGISASPEDTKNYTFMMREIRREIGSEKLLTIATQVGGGYIDLEEIEPLVDFVNIMAYDIGNPPHHHGPLFRSDSVGWISVEEGVNRHIEKGIPAWKLVLGISFYGHGRDGVNQYIDYRQILELGEEYVATWDNEAKVPYLIDEEEKFVCTFENPRSIQIKCCFLRNKGLRGAMYWEYNADDEQGTLRKTVYQGVLGQE